MMALRDWFLGMKKRQKRPTRAVIETTNRCNLNCPFCLVGQQNKLVAEHGNAAHDLMTRPMGVMSEEVFEVVRRNLTEFGIEKAYLHFQGEPFLNKRTPSFARALKDDGLEVWVFTNGQAFTDDNIRELADAQIDHIRFSVDGASEESYQQNRVGGTFARVFENMKKVSDAHKGKPTKIEWQFLALRNNEHEIQKARGLAEELGVGFFVKGFRETDAELAPLNEEYRSKYMEKPCKDIHLQLGIYWNGDVVPCCYDVDAQEVMGNLMDEALDSIWHSEKYTEFRRRVDAAVKEPGGDPALCRSCLRWR